MNKWYVEEVYTPDDADRDRVRRYGGFEAPKGTSIKDLAMSGLVSVGMSKEWASHWLSREADLAGTTVQGGKFDFEIQGDNGTFKYTMSKAPIERVAALVVMVNDQPVAVRSSQAVDLPALAAKHKLPVESFTVVRVEDFG